MTNNEWLHMRSIPIQDISVAFSKDFGSTRIFIIDNYANTIFAVYKMDAEGFPKERSYWLWKWLEEEHR